MEQNAIKITQKGNTKIAMRIIPGHFATNHSHINYYIDMTTLKIRQNEAQAVAHSLAMDYTYSTMIDTIVCMDGCDVIGAYLAEELSRAGIRSINSHNTLYVVTPEFDSNQQLIFRDNTQPALFGKHVLLLLASATTGKTIRKSLECISYYGGIVSGVSAIFSAVKEIDNTPIHSLFQPEDLPEYHTYAYHDCPLCAAGIPLDAIVNSFGYSKIHKQ